MPKLERASINFHSCFKSKTMIYSFLSSARHVSLPEASSPCRFMTIHMPFDCLTVRRSSNSSFQTFVEKIFRFHIISLSCHLLIHLKSSTHRSLSNAYNYPLACGVPSVKFELFIETSQISLSTSGRLIILLRAYSLIQVLSIVPGEILVTLLWDSVAQNLFP